MSTMPWTRHQRRSQQHNMASQARPSWIERYFRARYPDPAFIDTAAEREVIQPPTRRRQHRLPRLPRLYYIMRNLSPLVLILHFYFEHGCRCNCCTALALYIAIDWFLSSNWSFESRWLLRYLLSSVWDIQKTVQAFTGAIEPASEGYPF